jgi:hypothetical protein
MCENPALRLGLICLLCGCLEDSAVASEGADSTPLMRGLAQGPAAGAMAGAAAAGPPPTGSALQPVLPDADWTYVAIDGALCRDGSPAGYYLRRGRQTNLLIFLNGGGVCYDDFFCSINPANVNQSLPGENLFAATLEQLAGTLQPVPQTPPDAGVLSRDARNPVGDWSMMFVPYCTGDVYGGTTPDSPVITSVILPPQQFVGYTNLGLFYESLEPALRHGEKVVLAGSSAGSFGVLLNYDRTQRFFGDSRVVALADSGVAFRDPFLEPCLQKTWRRLWGLDKVLPPDCQGCFNADGGGLAAGLGAYLFDERYPGRLLGGLVSSQQDQIMKLFLSGGLNDCVNISGAEAVAAFIGIESYPADRYPEGIADFIDHVSGREQIASYLLAGQLHQHVFRTRYFDDNALGTSIAQWFAHVLDGEPEHLQATF